MASGVNHETLRCQLREPGRGERLDPGWFCLEPMVTAGDYGCACARTADQSSGWSLSPTSNVRSPIRTACPRGHRVRRAKRAIEVRRRWSNRAQRHVRWRAKTSGSGAYLRKRYTSSAFCPVTRSWWNVALRFDAGASSLRRRQEQATGGPGTEAMKVRASVKKFVRSVRFAAGEGPLATTPSTRRQG